MILEILGIANRSNGNFDTNGIPIVNLLDQN